jgi:predicted metal-dependent hydrolase
MIDWLLRGPEADPVVEAGGRQLPVAIRRLPRARRISLRLAPDGSEVRIAMPRWGRTDEALAFARSKAAWIAAQLERVPRPVVFAPGMALPYRGEQLVLRHLAAGPRRAVLDDGELVLGGPVENLQPRLRRWFEGEARRLLEQDLAFYCERAGQPQQRLMLSRAQRRWGSCARDGTVRINWRLVMAPDPVRRSVVAHEVAHLLHFDHSPAFHAALAAIFEGEVAPANRWLREQGRSLYALFG